MYNQGYRPQQQQAYPPNASAWYAPAPSTAAPTNRRRVSSGNGGSPRSPRTARKKHPFIKLLVILVLLAGATAGLYVWKTQADVRPYTSVFLPNVYVDGINLSGMTWEQANQAVQQQIDTKLGSWYVRLKSPTGQYKDITAATLGISRDASSALSQAWAIGHETSTTQRKTIFELKDELEAMKNTTAEFSSIEQSADTSQIDSILQTLAAAAYKAPQDAAFVSFNPDDISNPFTFQQEIVGQQLDTDALKTQILSMVETFTSGEVLIEPTPIRPNVTVADLQQNYTLRCRAITPIDSHSTDERNNNIRVAFGKFNGMVLKNGERFSYNKVVGRRTEKNGFYQAFEYSYGELTTGWGGGVCQASTTLYLGVVQSGLTITDHTSHSTPVSYTDMGKDATVSDTRGHEVDLAFKNETGGNIYLAAHVITDPSNKKRLLCEIRVYGTSLGTTRYELETEVVEKLEKPTEPEYIEDKNAKYVTYTDEEKTVIEATEGYVVDTYLCTVTDGVQVKREKIARSTYKNRAARIYVGVTPRDIGE